MTCDNITNKEARIEAFKKIADAKGYSFKYTEGAQEQHKTPSSGDFETRQFHYDALMVDQSIRDAIIVLEESLTDVDAAAMSRKQGLVKKLQRLLETGSAYEKAVFSLASDSYYFPEDVNAMAASAAQNKDSISSEKVFSCERICYVVCRCIGTHQDCKDMCRWVCNGAQD
ncbi:MAG: hypothetical protein K2Y09_04860 [Nitrosomonas sp.]|uniref:hypothetical protein n=1 Tax=Nitrosomonas sp. TaxID=42353 RepID=UPI001DB531C5|nr:hypothetical protein [Nitrosomonas sp.]MBX9894497.1 hypothetical protein [Nitrosomonas sp.]